MVLILLLIAIISRARFEPDFRHGVVTVTPTGSVAAGPGGPGEPLTRPESRNSGLKPLPSHKLPVTAVRRRGRRTGPPLQYPEPDSEGRQQSPRRLR